MMITNSPRKQMKYPTNNPCHRARNISVRKCDTFLFPRKRRRLKKYLRPRTEQRNLNGSNMLRNFYSTWWKASSLFFWTLRKILNLNFINLEFRIVQWWGVCSTFTTSLSIDCEVLVVSEEARAIFVSSIFHQQHFWILASIPEFLIISPSKYDDDSAYKHFRKTVRWNNSLKNQSGVKNSLTISLMAIP